MPRRRPFVPRTVPLRTALTALVLSVLGLAVTSTAAQALTAGDTILTSGLDMPAGNVGASDSGLGYGNPMASPTSTDGRYVAFLSSSDTIAPGANPDSINVFRKDRTTGEVVLVSRQTGAGGTGAVGEAAYPVISNDGNRIAWTTDARLVPGDVNNDNDVYVRDVNAGVTVNATAGITGGAFDFDLSGNGSYIAFTSAAELVAGDDNDQPDVYRKNLDTNEVNLASRIPGSETAGNHSSIGTSISDDGRWVAFSSQSTNIIAGYVDGDGGVHTNVYARDMTGGANYLISAKSTSGVTGANGDSSQPAIAGTPTNSTTLKVAYSSEATNVASGGVDASGLNSSYVRTSLLSAPSTLVSRATGINGASANNQAGGPEISNDGAKVVFYSNGTNLGPAGDNYGAYQRRLTDSTTTLISADNEYAAAPAISGDGTFATWFESGAEAGNDPDVFSVFGRTLTAGPIQLVSRPSGDGPYLRSAPVAEYGRPNAHAVSADGRYVVFAASSSRLPGSSPTRYQVFRRDVRTGALDLVSRANGPDGAVADDDSAEPSIDASGTKVAFVSDAALVAADNDSDKDVYVRDMVAGTTTLASRADGVNGVVSNDDDTHPSLSSDGTHVAFVTESTNLGVPGGDLHIFVRDLVAQTTIVADRATGQNGVVGNDNARQPSLSRDGRHVAFLTTASNLDADDPNGGTNDVYVRDTVAGTTVLASRRPGLNGARATGGSSDPMISADGTIVAFGTHDELVATEAGSWGGFDQIVSRVLATGANTLVSRVAGGAPGNDLSRTPSISGDGGVVTFQSLATNLLPGLGGGYREAVYARTMTTGALSGPPAFGLDISSSGQGSSASSISEDGRCMAFTARGHGPGSGTAGDFVSAYMYVVSGSCSTPLPDPGPGPGPSPDPGGDPKPPIALKKPVLSKASLTNRKFKVGSKATATSAAARKKAKKKTPTGTTVRFTLNEKASVTITVEQRTTGRKLGKRCVKTTKKLAKRKPCTRYVTVGALKRAGVAAGKRTVAFTGRIGKRKLALGRYRARIVARNEAGTSKAVTLTFSVVRR